MTFVAELYSELWTYSRWDITVYKVVEYNMGSILVENMIVKWNTVTRYAYCKLKLGMSIWRVNPYPDEWCNVRVTHEWNRTWRLSYQGSLPYHNVASHRTVDLGLWWAIRTLSRSMAMTGCWCWFMIGGSRECERDREGWARRMRNGKLRTCTERGECAIGEWLLCKAAIAKRQREHFANSSKR